MKQPFQKIIRSKQQVSSKKKNEKLIKNTQQLSTMLGSLTEN
jgi:hypothetical protein